jgi:uncharacterized protein YraI
MTDQEKNPLDACAPDLYKDNPFRLLRLPSEATVAAAKREVDRLSLSASLHGAGTQTEGILQAPPSDGSIHIFLSPDAEQAKDAFRRISSPELRLMGEFFWFWPHTPGVTEEDDALKAISRDDPSSALAVWQERAGRRGEHSVATHNLAVLHHLAALDLELMPGGDTLPDKVRSLRAANWQAAYAYWLELLQHPAFWRRLSDRVTALDDPRLPKDAGERFRSSLPLALLLINARLAVAYGDLGRFDDVRRQAALLDASGFPESDILRAKQMAIKPFRTRLDAACKSAEEQTDKDPTHADQVARDLLGNPSFTRGLETADILFRPEDATRIALHDDLALRAFSSLVAFANKTEEWEAVAEATRGALQAAQGEQAKSRIQEGLKTSSDNIQNDLRWRLPGYWNLPADTSRQLELAKQSLDAGDTDKAIGICSQLRNKAATDRQRWIIGRTLAICLYIRATNTLTSGMEPISIKPSYLITDADRTRAQGAIMRSADDLVNALKHDPGNRDIHKAYDQIRDLARNAHVSIADKPSGARPGVQPKIRDEVHDPTRRVAALAPSAPPAAPAHSTAHLSSPGPSLRGVGGIIGVLTLILLVVAAAIGIGGLIEWASHTPEPRTQVVYVTPTPRIVTRTPTKTDPPATPAEVAGVLVPVASETNLREGPGTSYSVLAVLSKGATVGLMARTADGVWLMVWEPEGEIQGWVNVMLLSAKQADVDALPVADSASDIGSVAWSTQTPRPTATRTPTPTRKPSSTPTRRPTSIPTRRPTLTSAPVLNVTVEVENLTSTSLTCNLTGPIRRSVTVPSMGTSSVYLAEGMYTYTCSGSGYEDLTGTKWYSSGEWTWTISDAP